MTERTGSTRTHRRTRPDRYPGRLRPAYRAGPPVRTGDGPAPDVVAEPEREWEADR